MFTSSPGCHNPTDKSSKNRKYLQMTALRVLLNMGLHSLKEKPERCKLFNVTSIQRFYVNLFKLFSPWPNDQTDSGSLHNTLLLHL